MHRGYEEKNKISVFEFDKKLKTEQKSFSINNRRYLGNKYKLKNFIRETILNECGEFETFADLFSGTGSVASFFQDKHLIVNDILYSNHICHQTWFGTDNYFKDKILNFIKKYNAAFVKEDNYVSKHFANTYFNVCNCRKIGFIREDIEQNFLKGKINLREKCILITSLLYAMDKIANTCGHYDSYRKEGNLEKELILSFPNIKKSNVFNELYNMDANKLVRKISADIVYLDPPYNSRQYCNIYHLLENISCWKKPKVFGEAKKQDLKRIKSKYCTNNAIDVFEDLIKHIKAKYIVLSYSDMAKKGAKRSNAKITDEWIYEILKTVGSVKVFEQGHKTFSTGKTDIKQNKERLFVCKCF